MDATREPGRVTSRMTKGTARPAGSGSPAGALGEPLVAFRRDCTPPSPDRDGHEHGHASQIVRTEPAGTLLDSGTKAKKKRAAFGPTIPRTRMGHAAAAAIMLPQEGFGWPVTRPKMLTTAQSSRAERPSDGLRYEADDRLINAIDRAQRALRRRERSVPRRPRWMVFSSGRISCS